MKHKHIRINVPSAVAILNIGILKYIKYLRDGTLIMIHDFATSK